MNWQLAVEKNLEALNSILAMLVAMVEMGGGAEASRRATLPRHLHRLVLRLLRPAEAAARRLIIVAARGLVVELPRWRMRKARPKPEPRTILVLDRVNGSIVSVPMVLPQPIDPTVSSHRRQRAISLSLFDPLTRFGGRRRYARPAIAPHIRSFDSPNSGRFVSPPVPVPPAADDPLDADRLHRRLDAIRRALDDLPAQANRLARWQARRDAMAARQRARHEDEAASDSAAPANRGSHDATQRRVRFQRSSPMRPGRPPGWRRKPNHDVYEVLNELHGLAIWARERRDSS